MHYSHYIKITPSRLPSLNENIFLSVYHIITEELGRPVQSDLAFASQNLKFAGQMSDDRH